MRGLRLVRTAPSVDPAAQGELARLVTELAVVHGKVTLSSGKEADYYVDLRRATLHHAAAPLIGRLLRQLTADWDYVAAGGLTLGADPVALSMMHAAAAAGEVLDAFVVRKDAKAHGMQRRIEGIEVAGQRVLAVEDTSTTGGSVLTAVDALAEAGAVVIGVATVVDRDTGAREAIEARGLPYRSLLGLADLGLVDGD
ncbi:orotate phosphoribosyltransferase [Actinokineospora terrae]|uniref:Orotate phosphoribosyltransferase n=1 Tax=Actinokineospora terrae TaxID=155974 RepID=A0A1H9W2H2_9PSEU|nr:orotate phosphoribosyltransferase [Actinokineospora terrae]SES28105.1 orotate phosphoribosyltransferase [Actinokineospora terrae]